MVTYDLLKRCASGDELARQQLILDNNGLLYMVVGRFRNRGVDSEDLYQLAAIGLLKAAEHFNAELGMQFSTYAVPMMMGEIRRYLRDNGPMKVSRSYKTLAFKAAGVREHLIKIKGTEPTLSEIAAHLSVEPEELGAALAASKAPESLEEPRGESALPLKELIPAEDKEEGLVDRLTLRTLIQALPEREKKILLLRYHREKTQSQIASQMGISQVQVSRIEKKILEKLRIQMLKTM